ncbi:MULTISPECIES: M15 family metallopeptidase [Ureibacillus]|uniref:M15 family metallopeptidase n=1 Tax=Ureibacillus TaxID=160795 RepID=UPI0003188D8C|nr:M15 family metallopeptidase [Ureibacillus thermosphaericus]
MSVTTVIRDLSQLLPVAQTACKLLFQECYKAGIRDIFITETYRTQERQNYLYQQGRSRPGSIITWTLNSRHTSRLAWDIAVAPPKDLYDVTTLNKVGAIARKLGITWGGDWVGSVDRPHFEVTPSWTMPKGYKLEGTVIVPTTSKLKVQLIIDEKDIEKGEAGVWDPKSPTMYSAAEQMLEQAVKEGLIQSYHLDDLRNKKMTADRLLGLYITIQQRRNKK